MSKLVRLLPHKFVEQKPRKHTMLGGQPTYKKILEELNIRIQNDAFDIIKISLPETPIHYRNDDLSDPFLLIDEYGKYYILLHCASLIFIVIKKYKTEFIQ